MQELTTGMREKGINSMEWVNREAWRRKRKETLGTMVSTWKKKEKGKILKFVDKGSNSWNGKERD